MKAYISSTYQDLKKHREAVYKSLAKYGLQILAMEDYVSSSSRPLAKCLEDVRDSDIYIGIVAWRYGFIPDKENPNSLSITELEYREAQKKGISCLLFILHEDSPWLPKMIDPVLEDKKNRITVFREHLQNEHIVSFFSSAEELASLVGAAVYKLINEKNNISKASTEISNDEFLEASLLTKHNLPSRNPIDLIGRDKELELITNYLMPFPNSFYTLISIEGFAGTGKTTLAKAIAYWYIDNYKELSVDCRYQFIIWMSAKPEILTTDGVFRRKSTIFNLDEIFSLISINLGHPEYLSQPTNHKRILVNDLLAKNRTLLILDNFETIKDDEIISFLYDIPSSSKVLITTRHKMDRCVSVRLASFNNSDAIKFTTMYSRNNGISVSDEQQNLLMLAAEGNPLALEWGILQIGAGLDISTVLDRVKNPEDDVAKYLLLNAIEEIKDTSAYQVFLLVGLFPNAITKMEAMKILSLTLLEVDLAFSKLLKLGLVSKTENEYEILSLTKEVISSQLQKDSQIKKDLTQKYINVFSDEINRFDIKRGAADFSKDFNFTKRDADKFIAASHYAYDYGMMGNVVSLADSLTSILWPLGYWNEWLEILDLAVYASKASNNTEMEAWFLKDQGWLYIERGDYINAKKVVEQSLELINQNDFSETLIACYRILAVSYKIQGNNEQALIYFNKAITLLEGVGNSPSKLASALSNRAEFLIDNGDFLGALDDLTKAANFLKSINDPWRLAKVEYLIAVCFKEKKEMSEAKKHLSTAKALNSKLSIERKDVYFDVLLEEIKILLSENRRDETRKLIQEAQLLAGGLGGIRKHKLDVLLQTIGGDNEDK